LDNKKRAAPGLLWSFVNFPKSESLAALFVCATSDRREFVAAPRRSVSAIRQRG
jgi:hypothetical protein